MITIDSLEKLFQHADIDDVTEEMDYTSIVFTTRVDSEIHMVHGEDLWDCLMQAERIVRRTDTLDRLRSEGLTDEDIDRLADDRVLKAHQEADDNWVRGFIAGAQDAADLLTQQALHGPAVSAPVAAAAGETVESSGLNKLSEEVQVALSGRSIAVELALLMPGRIVID